jgi:hypothetical protein
VSRRARPRVRPRRRRPPGWLLVGTVVALGAIAALLVWPSRSSERPARTTALQVAEVPAAVRALEGRLGAPQRYTEIKATVDGVSMFVVLDDAHDVPWFYRAGALEGPGAPQPVGTFGSFSLDGVAIERASAVARAALAQFDTAELEQFSLLNLPDAGVVWSLSLRSSKGGRIDATFTPAGEPRGAEMR